jgi:K+-transporting ATPase A subunit
MGRPVQCVPHPEKGLMVLAQNSPLAGLLPAALYWEQALALALAAARYFLFEAMAQAMAQAMAHQDHQPKAIPVCF